MWGMMWIQLKIHPWPFPCEKYLIHLEIKQECIPVGCIPAACWPYPRLHCQVGFARGVSASGLGGRFCLWSRGGVSHSAMGQIPPADRQTPMKTQLSQTSFAGGKNRISIGSLLMFFSLFSVYDSVGFTRLSPHLSYLWYFLILQDTIGISSINSSRLSVTSTVPLRSTYDWFTTKLSSWRLLNKDVKMNSITSLFAWWPESWSNFGCTNYRWCSN